MFIFDRGIVYMYSGYFHGAQVPSMDDVPLGRQVKRGDVIATVYRSGPIGLRARQIKASGCGETFYTEPLRCEQIFTRCP
jgi:hypothetical protein